MKKPRGSGERLFPVAFPDLTHGSAPQDGDGAIVAWYMTKSQTLPT